MKCLTCRNFVTAHAFLTGWHLFTFFTVAPFLCTMCTPSVILDLYYILVASNNVIWAILFRARRFSGFQSRISFSMLPHCPEKLSKFWHENSCFVFRKKFLGFIFFLTFFSCSTQLFKNQLKHTQDMYILFVFFFIYVACNCLNSSKQEVKHVYYNLSIFGEKYQLD